MDRRSAQGCALGYTTRTVRMVHHDALCSALAPPAMPIPPSTQSRYAARIDFVSELASHLHAYGTTAQRLEATIVAVADQLGVACEPWSSPTGLILSFSDPERAAGERDVTRVVRLAPGEVDLQRLADADRIAGDVVQGVLDFSDGVKALQRLRKPSGRHRETLHVLAFGLASAAVAGLLRLPWLDIGVAAFTGLMIGMLDAASQRRPALREAHEAIAGMLAGFIAIAASIWLGPLNLNTVIIASLIVLLPGLTLTNAVNELTSQHWVSGTARLAGAMATVMKLTVGTTIALQVAMFAGFEPDVRAWRPQPIWVEIAALALASYAFALLFRASLRDYPIVMLAAASGYLISRGADLRWGSPTGLFLSAMLTTIAGNAYARWWNRPGAIVRVPGMIMLVPGSAALRGFMTLLQQNDLDAGKGSIMLVLQMLLALIAGLLFGNLLLPPRRHL